MGGDTAGLRLAGLGVAWLGGALLQLFQPALWPAGRYAAAAAAALLLGGLAVRSRPAARAALAALALAAAGFGLAGLRAVPLLADRLAPALEMRELVVEGVVAGLPRDLPSGRRFVFEPARASDGGRPVALPARLLLGWYGGDEDETGRAWPPGAEQLQAGDRWRFTLKLKRPHGLANPHGFDTELWLLEQRIGATGTVRADGPARPQRLASAVAAPVERLRQQVRDAILLRLGDSRSAGVLAALAVGDQAAIERGDWALFRATGVAHLMAISGVHVTMFAWLAAALVGRLWRCSPWALRRLPAPVAARWGGVAAAAAYALLAGWGVPAQRTVWMLAVAALLAGGARRWPAPLVLLAAAVVVTALDPWALLQPGFWLSFAAVGLLMASASPPPREADDAPPPRWPARAAALLRQGLRTQALATLGLAPLTLVCFQQLSVVGFAANLVAIPLVTLLVTPLALAGVALPPLWSLAALLLDGLARALALLAAWPGALWSVAVAPAWAQLAGLVGGALAVLPLPWRLRLLAVPLLLPMLAPVPPRPAEGGVELVAADIGQGTAVLVRTRGHLLVYDAGPRIGRDGDAGERVLLPLLRARGERRIDLLVLSHSDTDHVGGAASLIAGLPVAALSSSLDDTHALRRRGPPHRPCEAGQQWQWDGVRFVMLHPPPGPPPAGTRPNARSCVLRIEDARGRRLLLTGDIEAAQEAALVAADPAALRADVLLAPHHGSRTSSTPGFLDAVAPHTVVVQAGYHNRYGHPSPMVLERYKDHGFALMRSDTCGAWTWLEGATSCARMQPARYWRAPDPAADGVEVASGRPVRP